MKKVFLKSLSLFLSLVILFSALPFSVFARENYKSDVNSDMSFGANGGLNNFANSVTAERDNEDYIISFLEYENSSMFFDVKAAENCKLVVAFYDEINMQMLHSIVTEIEAEASRVTVDISGFQTDKKYVVKAFLLDENNESLCKEYIDYQKTSAYEEFLDKEPEDFANDDVIIFDEQEGEPTDFAVFSDNVIDVGNGSIGTISTQSTMTFDYNEETSTYVFYNANDGVKNAKQGDILKYVYGLKSNEFLVIKVKEVRKSGDTVTIVEDTDISLSEAFDFLRFNGDGDFTDVKIDEEKLSDIYTVTDSQPITTCSDIDESISKSFESSLNVNYKPHENVSIQGTVGLKLGINAYIEYDIKLFGKDWYKFGVVLSLEIGLLDFSILGEISLPEELSEIPLAPKVPVGPFTIQPKLLLIVEFSGGISFSAKLTSETTVRSSSDNGDHRDSDTKFDWLDIEAKEKIEIKIGVGVGIEFSLVEIVSLNVSGSGGTTITFEETVVGVLTDKLHKCLDCVYGTQNAFYSFEVTLSIKLIPKVLEIKWDAIKLGKEWLLYDFHVSLSTDLKFHFGKGKCNNIYYATKMMVSYIDSDKNKKPISGAKIETKTGCCDSDKDGDYDDLVITTNAKGEAILYHPSGQHIVVVSATGFDDKEQSFRVSDCDTSVGIVMNAIEQEPEEPTEPDDGDETGSVKWKYNSSTKTLTIYGTGKMDDYSTFGVSPWDAHKEDIENIVVESGVTSLGDYAFAQCTNLEKVTIADTVTDIGMASFYQCDALKSLALPNSVKVVDDYAFYGCYSMKTLNLGNVERIGAYAFAQCTALENVTVPMATTNIGDSAFAWCQGLKSITFFNKNCSIYDSANTIWQETEILAPLGSKAQSYANKYGRTFSSIVVAGVVDTTEVCDAHSITVPSCVAGNDYILLNVTGYSAGFELSTTNLEYIDQLTADNNGVVNTSFIPRRDVAGSTTLLIGDFGNGVEVKVVTPKFLSVDIEIVNNPGTKTINYGEGIRLYATATDAAGYTIKWYVNGTEYCTGDTFEYRSLHDDIEVTVKLVDSNGNPVVKDGSEISENETINVKDGFFQKLAAFFKFTLFRQVVIKTN